MIGQDPPCSSQIQCGNSWWCPAYRYLLPRSVWRRLFHRLYESSLEFARVTALTHVRVIDGTGAAALEVQTILLSHGKIEAV